VGNVTYDLIVLIFNLHELFLFEWNRKMCESINGASVLASRIEEVQLWMKNS